VSASVPEAILGQSNVPPNVMLAELVGSYLESSWNPSAVGDQGTSVGPYQIHLPAHPGVTSAEASDPVWSTAFMTPAYEAAAAQIPSTLWQSDPEQAAEQTAVLAERPAQTYYAARGQGSVDAAYTAALGALGVPSSDIPSGSTASTPSGSGWPTGTLSIGTPLGSWSIMSKSTAMRIGLMVFGILVLFIAFHALAYSKPGDGPITVVTDAAHSANAPTGPAHTPMHKRAEHAAEEGGEVAAA
jgi:hypothetical protein